MRERCRAMVLISEDKPRQRTFMRLRRAPSASDNPLCSCAVSSRWISSQLVVYATNFLGRPTLQHSYEAPDLLIEQVQRPGSCVRSIPSRGS